MNGRMISGPGDSLSKMVADRARLSQTGANPQAVRDLDLMIESRKRLDDRRALLDKVPPSVAMDALNSWHEAREQARKMLAAGYSIQQVKAAVRPLLVNPNETIGSRKSRRARRKKRREARKKRREERRKAGKGIFRKIGKAIKKGAKFIFRGAAKLNPVLVGARAAVLSLIKKNAGGLATKFKAMGAERARNKWENLGGSWRSLQRAVERGAGSRITGFRDDGGTLGADEDADESESSKQGESGLDKLWTLAKPILEKLLGAFGIVLSGSGKATKVEVKGGSALDRQVKAALEKAMRLPESDATKAVREQAEDAANPSTGGGAGFSSGVGISPVLLAGLAALLIFATRNR